MDESVIEIENWRGSWYYKFGSRYTGPYHRHDDATAAAERDLGTPDTCHRIPVRASLAKVPAFSELG